jgi:hypothetical protein
MPHDQSMLYGHIFLFLTTMAGFAFQWFREARQHRWERERYETLRSEIKNGSGLIKGEQ